MRLDELESGDRLAIVRQLPEPEDALRWPEARLVLLAHLIGDGSYLPHQPLRYTTASEENSRAVQEAAESEFGAAVNRHVGRGRWHQLVIRGNGNRWHPAGAGLWLRELGVFGQRCHQKRVPAEVFALPNDQIALFLRHLWATDGCVFVRTHGKGAHRVYFSSCSAGLALDVAALLLRFGIVARLRQVHSGTSRPVHTVDVSGAEAQRRFLDCVGAFGPRRAPADRLATLLAPVRAETNVDTLPQEVFGEVRAAMRRQGVSTRAMAALRGTSYGGSSHFSFAPSRAALASYAQILDDAELRARASSDLFWDSVVSVLPDGEEDVYDLTVPGPASWLADGIVSHNSGAIEQDADIVMFIYREEEYKATDENRGMAEIIIGKQRNGPTGVVRLVFIKEFTRFENLEMRAMP